MKQALFTYLIVSFSIFCNGQTVQDAKILEDAGYYTEAILSYNKILNYNLTSEEALVVNKHLLFAYIKTFNYNRAYEIYTSTTFINLSQEENYNIFQLLRSVGKYEDARTLFNQIGLKKELFEQQYIDWPLNQTLSTNKVQLTNITNIKHCHGISFYKDGLLIPTAITNNKKTASYDIYHYQRQTDTTFEMNNSPFLSSSGNFYRGTPFFDSINNTLIYTTNNSERKTYKVNKEKQNHVSKKGKNNLQLLSFDIENKITTPLFKKNNDISIHTPFLYHDNILFFSSTSQDSNNKSNIYFSIKINNNWSTPQLLQGVNTFENDVYPYIVRDNFYYSSRGLEGFGGLDIYEGKLIIDSLGVPSVKEIKNMGRNINSSYDDFAFIINKKGQAFFASNRNTSNGEDEIYTTNYFKSILIKGKVLCKNKTIDGVEVNSITEQLIDKDINLTSSNGIWKLNVTEADSVQVSFSRKGYFKKIVTLSSPSVDSNYVIQLTEKPNSFQLNNSITDQPITNASITIYEKREPNGWIKKELVTTDENGEWSFDFDVEKKYKITVEAKNYQKKEIYIPKDERELNDIDFFADISPLALAPQAKGTLTINNIYFDYNSATITNISIPILDNLIDYLKENTNSRIELSAHTDCIGGDDYNLKLSDSRAQSCFNYLIKNNISKQQIVAKGYGEQHLINSCSEQRKNKDKAKLNRRIEVKFLN